MLSKVYMLERLSFDNSRYDVDTVILSGADSDMAKVFEIAEALRGEGKSVRAERGESTAQRCGQLLKVSKEGVEALEAND